MLTKYRLVSSAEHERGDILLKQVTPIRRAAGLPIRDRRELEQIVEPPLREAVWRLIQGGVETVYSSANLVGRTKAQLWVRATENLLSSGELRVFELDGEQLIVFSLEISETTTCEEVYLWSQRISLHLLSLEGQCSSVAQ